MAQKMLKPRKYFVLFLDFLGQKDAFESVSQLQPGDEIEGNLASVSDAVRRAIGGAKLLHETIIDNSDSLFRQLQSRGVRPFSQAPAKWFEFEMSRFRFGVQQFSDGTVIYFDLNDDLTPIVMPSCMFALCRLFLRCVYEGALPRGGMTIGEGVETEEGCLYGPVVDRVEQIERVVAQYPRVVISDDLVDYLDRHSVIFEETERGFVIYATGKNAVLKWRQQQDQTITEADLVRHARYDAYLLDICA